MTAAAVIFICTGISLLADLSRDFNSITTDFLRVPKTKYLLWISGTSLLTFLALLWFTYQGTGTLGNLRDISNNRVTTINQVFLNFKWVLLLLAPLIIMHVLLLYFLVGHAPWIINDSLEYLGFAPWRTLGYPFFIRFLANITDTSGALVVIQFVAALFSTFILLNT